LLVCKRVELGEVVKVPGAVLIPGTVVDNGQMTPER
jgi:hypothetical protein